MQLANGQRRLERVQIVPEYEERVISAEVLQHWPCPDFECNYCDEHFRHIDDQASHECMWYDRNVSSREAADTTNRLVSNAQMKRQRLQQLIADHGDVFLSRWKKRSKDKRQDILLRANANLPEHRDIDEFKFTQGNGGRIDWKAGRNTKARLASLLPYLASEPLRSNAALLFALIHYRTEHTLEQWAAFDIHQFRDAWKVGLLATEFTPNCVVTQGPSYGELVLFEPDSMHRNDTVGYPRGRMLLEAQSGLMDFLVEVVESTLEGANLDTPSSSRWMEMCNDRFRSTGDVAQWSTYSNQPFSPPPVFDIDAFLATVQSRLDHEADHLALMQTDPAYARRYIRLLFQGEAYKAVPRAVAFEIVDAHISMELRSLHWWICVKEEAEHVRDLRQRFRDQINPGSPLPPKYDRALAALEVVLVNFMIGRCDTCRIQFEQRPGFARYYRFEHTAPGKMTMTRLNPEPIPNKLFKDPLYWCLMNLCGEPDQKGNIDHARLFAFLENHLASSSHEERGRVDQTVIDKFSELAVNHQLLLAIRLGRPQNTIGDGTEFLKTEKRRAWRCRLLKAGHVEGSETRTALLQRFYETPPPQGRKGPAWLRQHDEVLANLARYWSSLRGAAKDLQEPDVAHFIRADLEPSHLVQVAAQRQVVLDEIASKAATHKPVEPVQLPREPDRPRFEMLQTTVKTKTRPDKPHNAGLDDPLASEVESMSIHDERTPTNIQTSKRALDVFKKMFAADVEEAAQGCEWDAFVHAMRDLGFIARNSAGSAVGFELPEGGKIVFHKPHPTPKIDPIMLRAMGKRLHKWFGFSRQSFALSG